MIKEFEFSGLRYTVSDDGRVFGAKGNELNQRLDADGYPIVSLGSKHIRRIGKRVHRIVCEHFVPKVEGKPEVNHIDGIKRNNHFTNLEWNNRQEQMIHAFKLGLKKGSKGSKNGRAILSETDVIEIRKLYNEGWKISQLRDKFVVGWTTIKHVVSEDTWK